MVNSFSVVNYSHSLEKVDVSTVVGDPTVGWVDCQSGQETDLNGCIDPENCNWRESAWHAEYLPREAGSHRLRLSASVANED